MGSHSQEFISASIFGAVLTKINHAKPRYQLTHNAKAPGKPAPRKKCSLDLKDLGQPGTLLAITMGETKSDKGIFVDMESSVFITHSILTLRRKS